MSAEMLPAALLKRKAVVYVRQSTQSQVQTNLESQRRQYDLVELARRYGFSNIEVIDDDLGRSASGSMSRPGFDRLVAAVCAGEVGAVLCLDASRLSRNGRDWHHLLELCGLVQARVIDTDGVYDPCQIRRLIKEGILAADQVVPDAPYQIRASDLQDERVTTALARKGRPCRTISESQTSMFSDT
jgi:Resolvase, N terminal domain